MGIEGDVPGEFNIALCAASSARVHLDERVIAFRDDAHLALSGKGSAADEAEVLVSGSQPRIDGMQIELVHAMDKVRDNVPGICIRRRCPRWRTS